MLGFFNKENSFVAAMRLYNSVAFVYAAYSYYTNPEASWDEQGAEMALAALNLLTLREGTDVLEAVALSALNFMGVGANFRGYTSECTSIGSAVNLVGGLGHLLTGVACVVNNMSDQEKTSARPS